MASILRVRDKSGKITDIPAIKGASAYEIAVENGFSGTESEWLESLKGGVSEKPTSTKIYTSNDMNITFLSESTSGSSKTFYMFFIEAEEGFAEGTDILDIEISCPDIDGGEYISIHNMYKYGFKPYMSMIDKVTIHPDYGYVICAIYFPTAFNSVIEKADNFEWNTIRITYREN